MPVLDNEERPSNEWFQFLCLKNRKRRAQETQCRKKEIIKIKTETKK